MRATPAEPRPRATPDRIASTHRPAETRRRRDDPRTTVSAIIEVLSRTFVSTAAVTLFIAGVVLLIVLLVT